MPVRRYLLAATSLFPLAVLAAPQCAMAQSSYVPPPPQFVTDPNGVDVRSLLLNYTEEDLSAGSGVTEVKLARSIPTHKRTGRQEFGKWIHSFTGYAYTKFKPYDDTLIGAKVGDTTLHAVIGSKSLSFYMEFMMDWEADNPATSIVTTGDSPILTATVTDADGTKYEFQPSSSTCGIPSTGYENYCGNIKKVTEPNGAVWNYTYSGGNLVRVTSNLLFGAVFEYSGSPSALVKACLVSEASHYVEGLTTCPAGVPAASYTATTATRPDGSQSVYSSTVFTFSVRNAGDTRLKLHYAKSDGGTAGLRKNAALDGTGGDYWQYGGTYLDLCGTCIYQDLIQRVVTAPDLSQVKYDYKSESVQSVNFIEPLPNKITNGLNNVQQIVYGGTGGVLNGAYMRGPLFPYTVTQPQGDKFTYTYDSRGNRLSQTAVAKSGSGLANIVTSAAYPVSCTNPKICNKPTSVTDARGAVTDFAYDAAHGGVLSEMGPAPVAGAARPLKLTTWAQRYAWIKNSGGVLVQAATPVWVKATETKCQTAAGSSTAACDAGASQTVTTYEYGATGTGEALLVKGVAVASGGTTLRTCYQYDSYARKIAETKPNANLGVCP